MSIRSRDLTSSAESSVDEFSCGVEVDAHVKGGRVVGFDAVIRDVHAGVILCPSSPFTLCAVEDVCDPQLYQLFTV